MATPSNPLPQPGLLWCPRTRQQEDIVYHALNAYVTKDDEETNLIRLMLETIDYTDRQRRGVK